MAEGKIDIFSIKPHEVTRDMSGKTVLVYGDYKTGKTTIACKFPKPLLMAFEKGYNMIPGVIAQPINSMREAFQVKKQLIQNMRDYEAGKIDEPVFKTVIVDTADIAWEQCEKFVASQADVSYVDELAYGRGNNRSSIVYNEFFQDLARAGYAVVAISHATSRTVKLPSGQEVTKTMPSLKPRAYEVVGGMVDLIAYAYPETRPDGSIQLMLRMRDDGLVEAGSRNPFTSEVIPFTYEALMEDMGKAMDRIGETAGQTISNTPNNPYQEQIHTSYQDLMRGVGTFAKTLREGGYADKYQRVIEKHLGKDKLAKDCTESQIEVLGVIHDELEAIVDDLGLIPAA